MAGDVFTSAIDPDGHGAVAPVAGSIDRVLKPVPGVKQFALFQALNQKSRAGPAVLSSL